MPKLNRQPNTTCSECGTAMFRWPYMFKRSPVHFCSVKCKGKWMTTNLSGEQGHNWKGGSWNNRVQYLAHTSYRTWRKKLLKDAVCFFCGIGHTLELHHIESKIVNPSRIKDESNVMPICSKCHDVLHSHSSKGDELRGTLNAILAHGNPQPILSNVLIFVGRKVQRLMGEDTQTNKPNTSIAPERDDIVRAYTERIRSNV